MLNGIRAYGDPYETSECHHSAPPARGFAGLPRCLQTVRRNGSSSASGSSWPSSRWAQCSLMGARKNDAPAQLPDGAESTQVIEVSKDFPSSDEVPVVLVYERPEGLIPADTAAVTKAIDQLRTVAGVNPTVAGPVPPADQQALQVIITLIPGSGGWSTISTTIAEIKQIASGVPPGLSMHVTGPGGVAAESSEPSPASTAS